MGENRLFKSYMKISTENVAQNVMDILEEKDGLSFDEKKRKAMAYLKMQADILSAKNNRQAALNSEIGKQIKDGFRKYGDIAEHTAHVHIRAVQDADKEKFLELQTETCIVQSMLKEEASREMLWNEHIQDKSLKFTITVDGEYAGYCGINDLTREVWEIAIELLKKYHGKGVGHTAISIMLSEIKSRLGVEEFRVKIDPDNLASRRLFEKLGAVPYGIAEYFLHKEEDIARCEEENLSKIDDRLIQLAEKFAVEPRKLLSHVLEYELRWQMKQQTD